MSRPSPRLARNAILGVSDVGAISPCLLEFSHANKTKIFGAVAKITLVGRREKLC